MFGFDGLLPFSAACPSHSKEGAARVDWHGCVAISPVCTRTNCMDDRKNRRVLVSMAAGVSILDAHNGPYWRMVWLPLWILALP